MIVYEKLQKMLLTYVLVRCRLKIGKSFEFIHVWSEWELWQFLLHKVKISYFAWKMEMLWIWDFLEHYKNQANSIDTVGFTWKDFVLHMGHEKTLDMELSLAWLREDAKRGVFYGTTQLWIFKTFYSLLVMYNLCLGRPFSLLCILYIIKVIKFYQNGS